MEKSAYTDLEVWKHSRELANRVYAATKLFPNEEIYGLTQQMRRCAVSIPSNFADGCGRNHTEDSFLFLDMARGAMHELKIHLYLGLDQSCLDENVPQ